MTSSEPITGPRLDSLTGLRFFAALLVFLHHSFANTIVPGALAQVPGTSALAHAGAEGVTFFFVLSGFVLTWSWEDGRPTSGFYGRRFARVWPLHALTFLLAALVGLPLLDRPGTTLLQAILVLPLLQAWVPDPTIYFAGNGPSWSLSCEAFFYALVPLLVNVFRRFGARAAKLAVAGCFLVLGIVPLVLWVLPLGRYALLSLWVFPPYRVCEFAIGVIAGLAMRRGWRPRWSPTAAACALGACYVIGAAVLSPLYPSGVRAVRDLASLYGDLFVVLPVAALIVAVAARDIEGRSGWLATRPLVRLGAGSFAFYLTHSMVILTAAGLPSWCHALRGIPLALLALLVALAVADVLHHHFERPIEARIRKRLLARERQALTGRVSGSPPPSSGVQASIDK